VEKNLKMKGSKEPTIEEALSIIEKLEDKVFTDSEIISKYHNYFTRQADEVYVKKAIEYKELK
jgi:hypothetical protein